MQCICEAGFDGMEGFCFHCYAKIVFIDKFVDVLELWLGFGVNVR